MKVEEGSWIHSDIPIINTETGEYVTCPLVAKNKPYISDENPTVVLVDATCSPNFVRECNERNPSPWRTTCLKQIVDDNAIPALRLDFLLTSPDSSKLKINVFVFPYDAHASCIPEIWISKKTLKKRRNLVSD